MPDFQGMSSLGVLEGFLTLQGFVVLDGGLATELEANGCDLNDDLWSARILIEVPDAIKKVHLAYLEAGADCFATASYQATVQGFSEHGFSTDQAKALLLRSVEVATDARDTFWSRSENRQDRLRPLIAASIGPYGAYLADGSEFRGDYDLSVAQLYEFHRPRWEILAASSADLLACETIPSAAEARALARLIAETPDREAWISFTCPTTSQISDGSDLKSIVSDLSRLENVAAIGINCTAPKLVSALIETLSASSQKPIVVYPNSGEVWHQQSRSWLPGDPKLDLAREVQGWHSCGAQLIGGCCRTTPDYIRTLRTLLVADHRSQERFGDHTNRS